MVEKVKRHGSQAPTGKGAWGMEWSSWFRLPNTRKRREYANWVNANSTGPS
jgi:hypothetical protein